MPLFKIKRLRTIFFIYWFLLSYILAALIWWFIALNQQNTIMTDYKLQQIEPGMPAYQQLHDKIEQEKKRKTAQFIGEGVTFLILIIAGAAFVFRVVRRQFLQSQQQHNFMMAITHELKTPIAVTKLNLETLLKHKLQEAQQKKLITNTIQEASRLNDLCNNMLLASQIESGGYILMNEQLNISEVVNNCVNDFITRFSGRKIGSFIEPSLIVSGDMLLLQMAVNNLLDNAIKYSSKESTVFVSLKAELNKIILSVKDEGKGIAEDEKQKIFLKYYRSGNQHTKDAKGTGLGLFLTKNIIQQHKGDIKIIDNTPQGSIFEIHIKT